jgi:uncharacterized membrane protein YidH (DUF202 family)
MRDQQFDTSTRLAIERTRLANERTLMAWIRTSAIRTVLREITGFVKSEI